MTRRLPIKRPDAWRAFVDASASVNRVGGTYLNVRGERSSGHTFQLTYAIVPEAGLLAVVA